MSNPSAICQESVFVAEPAQLPQNNWLITQFISTAISGTLSYQTVIYVNITYTFDETCSPDSCHPSFILKRQFTSGVNQTAANDTESVSYENLAQYTPSNVATNMQFATVNFTVQNENGFYLALFDNGTNVTISRVLVYRFKGPAKQVDKTIYAETPAPATGTITVMGQCIANARTPNGYTPNVTLDSSGVWSNPDSCMCIEGHEPTMIADTSQCQGQYLVHNYNHMIYTHNTNTLTCTLLNPQYLLVSCLPQRVEQTTTKLHLRILLVWLVPLTV